MRSTCLRLRRLPHVSIMCQCGRTCQGVYAKKLACATRHNDGYGQGDFLGLLSEGAVRWLTELVTPIALTGCVRESTISWDIWLNCFWHCECMEARQSCGRANAYAPSVLTAIYKSGSVSTLTIIDQIKNKILPQDPIDYT